MLIVAGHITVAPADRDTYLQTCDAVVDAARRAPGCLDFAIGADLVDPARITIYERWDSVQAVEAFRGSGTDDGQAAMIVSASVAEYEVTEVRQLG
ncbi:MULTISPECIES: antibiotic biosynthesis monooxygenase family protein [unclassified Gordonia (in: high G+C Gram-positive bacteria)]|uniref:putative quinol monooxygenase n=1 Tax=unclassified Gordonia (in: high G+C Gram-positive bacteria) TaxID=2657482 RepID=UPI001F0DDA14|nr:antibiotic biosynthesis monooxygenase family protein [Gordonia sp. ABSL49_1]MCH5644604.1 antibiotic biosynthesis monooxygenase [Gordonia sp. ABSL49_1]